MNSSTNTYTEKGARGIFFPYLIGETQGETAAPNFLYVKDNHLGNVLDVVSDQKIPHNSSGTVDYYNGETVSATDYYSFGAPMPLRQFNSPDYRYGFGSQEKDDEITGSTGTHYTALFWEYDARTGRRWNTDPKPQTGISEYATFNDNPIKNNDPNGDCPTCLIGGLVGAAVDYGTQVAANYYEGRDDIFTDNINVTSIGISAAAGFLTSGASVVESVGAKLAVKTAGAVINNTVRVTTSKDGLKVDVEKNPINIVKNTAIDIVAEGTVKAITPGAKTISKQLSKVGINKGEVSTIAKNALKSLDVDITRNTNQAIKKGAENIVQGTASGTEKIIKGAVNAVSTTKIDEVKKETNK